MSQRDDILVKVSKGTMTVQEADKLLEALAPSTRNGRIYFKVSPKGAISGYGLQRMPVTLYVEQWETVLGGPGDCVSPWAVQFWAFVKEWDGKEYQGVSQDKPYTAKITRKADKVTAAEAARVAVKT